MEAFWTCLILIPLVLLAVLGLQFLRRRYPQTIGDIKLAGGLFWGAAYAIGLIATFLIGWLGFPAMTIYVIVHVIMHSDLHLAPWAWVFWAVSFACLVLRFKSGRELAGSQREGRQKARRLKRVDKRSSAASLDSFHAVQ